MSNDIISEPSAQIKKKLEATNLENNDLTLRITQILYKHSVARRLEIRSN